MHGLMQERPLLVSAILRHAARHHGTTEIVSESCEGGRQRIGYAALERRARRLARALGRLGVQRHERIGTLAWNSWRHLEIYYAVSGMGAVCHTINPRLFDDQIAYIIGHAEDALLFADLTFVPLVERLVPQLEHRPRGVVVMTDAAHMPELALPAGMALHCYETLLAEADEDLVWPELDERTASSLCYTSGTTGPPKGVLYSHRSTVLHAWGVNTADMFGLRAVDRVLPAVPMFHVNAWGLPYAAPMVGAALVLPGSRLDGPGLQALLTEERVTMAAGVPTVWLNLLHHLRASGAKLDGVGRLVIGGSACPALLIEAYEREHGVRVDHAWGMTELSPVGAYNRPRPGAPQDADGAALAHRLKQGRACFGIDLEVVDPAGRPLPWDGTSQGDLLVRGPWVCSAYYRDPDRTSFTADGWLRTGDVVTIDPHGFMAITDRTKDVIKSGGEWISSIALENIALAHPAVREAAVIAARHPKWDERPLLLVVPQPGADPDPAELLAVFTGKVARWWIPDAVLIVAELPHTATGKLAKRALRETYGDFYLRERA